ncbi:uncharacterized protein SETTUDRAFT_163868 [Exserohilum turcica Et28A]|uniref:Uncharacterized protein n=1 Tax=Exserohilum turcicum (strain 28A) TaxID=671987 RepID=R0K6K6_EXST2|nr:uncharacterized protein SETTUDRAFT_163868 [Exserohilum turcica Et28A]EOA85159.1 hypothetical protein SETTUDRAFT_163868 [Exserohilum turcica Et28A]
MNTTGSIQLSHGQGYVQHPTPISTAGPSAPTTTAAGGLRVQQVRSIRVASCPSAAAKMTSVSVAHEAEAVAACARASGQAGEGGLA